MFGHGSLNAAQPRHHLSRVRRNGDRCRAPGMSAWKPWRAIQSNITVRSSGSWRRSKFGYASASAGRKPLRERTCSACARVTASQANSMAWPK